MSKVEYWGYLKQRLITEPERQLERLAFKKRLHEEDYVSEIDSMRVGNAERDRYAAHLGEMFAQGYLDEEEFRERCDSVNSAKAYGQLRPALRGLPPLPAEPVKDTPLRGTRALTWAAILIIAIVLAMVICAAVMAML